MDTPTLQSIKWWPGALGKAATHGVIYAQLIIDGKEYGLNVFMVQTRDENFNPLPGILVGIQEIKWETRRMTQDSQSLTKSGYPVGTC